LEIRQVQQGLNKLNKLLEEKNLRSNLLLKLLFTISLFMMAVQNMVIK